LSHQLKIRIPKEWVPLMRSRALASGFSDTTSGRSNAVSQWLKSLIAKEIDMQVSDYHKDRSMLWKSLSRELQNFEEAFSAMIEIDSSRLIRATYELGGLLQRYTRDDPRWWDHSRPDDNVAHDDPIHELAHRAVHHSVYFLSLGDNVFRGETPPRGKAGNLIPKIESRLTRRRAAGLSEDWRDALLLAGLFLCKSVVSAAQDEELTARYAERAIAEVDKAAKSLPEGSLEESLVESPDQGGSEQREWLEKNCPTLDSLRNKKKDWPSGFVSFVSGRSKQQFLKDHPVLAEAAEPGSPIDGDDALSELCEELGESERQRGRELLLKLESAMAELATRTHVGKNFRNLVRSASNEDKVIELLTEANVTNVISRLLERPELSPETNPPPGKGRQGKNCDLAGLIQGEKLWFEIKAYADHPPEQGEARVRALSADGFQQLKDPERQVERPRAWNSRNRLDGQTQVGKPPSGIPEQFRDGEVNIAVVNERSWDAFQHLAAACYGDRWRLPPVDHVDSPVVFDDGLFAKERWKKVAAVALVTEQGESIALRWCVNPNASRPISAETLRTLENAFKPDRPLQMKIL
jgi:hypothetical protein